MPKKVITTDSIQKTDDTPRSVKKTKKPVTVVASISSDGNISGSLQPLIKRPLIAHLPISSSAIMFSDDPPAYDPKPPQEHIGVDAYNTFSDNPFMDAEEQFVGLESDNNDINDELNKAKQLFKGLLKPENLIESMPKPDEKVVQQPAVTKKEKKEVAPLNPYHLQTPLFAEYQGGNIPDTVETACFWCCHRFDWKPVVIPSRYENPSDKNGQGVYKVYGNFCTPECGMAYLLNEHIDMNSRWERISWLHHIYCTPEVKRIYPAPGREVLKMFGGAYEIHEFRETSLSRKHRVDINYPPMTSLLATMDTKPIDFYESTQKNGDNVGDCSSMLRLKRTKPLKELENTLDSCLNIQIRKLG